MDFEVYYDYHCPFVYRASMLLDSVRESGQRSLGVRWRYFSLTQVNSRHDGWTVWGAPESELVRGRLAFKAAEAARKQDRFEVFHPALLKARHLDRLDIDDIAVVEQVAVESGVDLESFRADIASPSITEALASDHQHAVATHGVFGTPTFVFSNGSIAYVRLSEAPTGADAVRVFDSLLAVAADEPGILEIKRPAKPPAA